MRAYSEALRPRALAAVDGVGTAVQFVTDNVYNLSPEKHGTFDIVLCLGLLLHLARHPNQG